MLTQWVGFASAVLAALALAPAMAHVLEMRGKLALSRDEYRTVQRIYRGWSRLGVVVVAALGSTALLAWRVRDEAALFVPAASAFACIAATQAVFWIWTFPVNRVTSDWTRLPDDWTALRLRWEGSHAVSAVFNLVAVMCIATMLARLLRP
jgi:hypothetical protein